MNIYDTMYEAFQSADLLHCGEKLVEFSEAAYREKNRATLVKHFYERLHECTLIDYAFENMLDQSGRRYYICDSEHAVGMFIGLGIPGKTTPIKSLNEIRSFGEKILLHYTKPVGKGISKESLESILQFLDVQYAFGAKVFAKRKAAFILMPYSHKGYNSECLIIDTGAGIAQHFFLYHMKEKGRAASNPEAVLFHELGHAMHACLFGDITQVPDSMLDLLASICFPTIKQVTAAEQCEVFADVLSMGLMYQTPWEKCDMFEYIHPDDKKIIKMLTEKLLESL